MFRSILTTKLYIPPARPDWVPRQRLVKRLDQGLRRKLTLVSAPAGYGKTTLISAWLSGLAERLEETPRVAWLSLEEDDNEPDRFLAYFIAALQTWDRGIGEAVLALLETPQLPPLTQLMTLLINDLADLPGQGILVLDDYNTIHHPDIETALSFLLEHLPPQLHLIVATREEPLLQLPRLRVRWQVTEVRLQDLRFTREETTSFLSQTMGLELSAEAIEILDSRTEGWIAGLQMVALSLRGRARHGGPEEMRLTVAGFDGSHHYIMDYLAAEVLRQQPAEIRTFLRQTAILDRLSGPLCDTVTGQQNSRHFLAQLEQANLFLIRLDDQRQWYAYHSLFADFLRRELAEWEQKTLHQRASQWYEKNGYTPEAIKHALAAHDLDTAERLIGSSVEETFSRGGFSTLLGWLNALPEERVLARSDFSAYKGWILYLRGEIGEAERYVAAATHTQRPDDTPVQRGMLLGFQTYLAINRGDPAEAVRLGQEALALLGDTESFFRTTALSHLAQAQRLTGQREAAIQTLRQTVSLGHRLGHHLITLEALGYLTLLLYQQGELAEAVRLCEQAVGRYTDARNNPLPMAGLVYIPLGTLYFELNDLEKAEHFLTTGIALCQQMGTLYYTLVGHRFLARLHYARGDQEAAWRSLEAGRYLALQSGNPRRIRIINTLSAELQLRQGQVAAAARTLADLPADRQARSEQENLTVARLMLAQGDPQAASNLLDQLEQSARQQSRLGSLITIHVLQSLTEQALNRPDAALDRLEQALLPAARLGYRRAFLDEGSAVVPLLSARRQVAPDFAGLLLDILAAAPAGREATPGAESTSAVAVTDSAENQALIEPLSETQLAILRLVAEGLTNQEIAGKLAITVGTVKWHLNQIYGKLNVSSRTQALAQARRLKLL
jgi:LuxR family transcriptional regulator, maltose regulon positive regulatory protein